MGRLLPPLAAFLFSAALAFALAGRTQAAAAPVYLALGDSLAFGVGADSPADQGYVRLTYFNLKTGDARFQTSGLDLVNLSEPGATSADLVTSDGQLDKAIAEIEGRRDDATPGNEVRMITLDIGGNDLLALAATDAPCVQNANSDACKGALSAALRELHDDLSATLQRLRGAAPDAEIYVLDLYNPYFGQGNDRALIASVGVQEVNGVIGAVATDPDYKAKLVSVFALFQGRTPEWVASDGIHPNNNGYRVMAEALMASIQAREVSLPDDLVNPATAAASGDPGAVSDGGGVDTTIVVIALPLVFIAGAMLSAAYFLVLGRR